MLAVSSAPKLGRALEVGSPFDSDAKRLMTHPSWTTNGLIGNLNRICRQADFRNAHVTYDPPQSEYKLSLL